MSERLVTIAVGRNLKGTETPLPAREWADFRASLLFHTQKYGTLVFDATGIGRDTTTGKQEDTFVLGLTYTSNEHLASLRNVVRSIAFEFDQAEFAFTHSGETEFVAAAEGFAGRL